MCVEIPRLNGDETVPAVPRWTLSLCVGAGRRRTTDDFLDQESR